MRRAVPVLLVAVLVIFAGCVGAMAVPSVGTTPWPVDENRPGGFGAASDGDRDGDGTGSAGVTDGATDDRRPTDDALELHTIDVGQADATLVIAPSGETMLIDTGDWRDGGSTVLAYLDGHDVTRIDHLVTTHAHADHIGGHDVVIEAFEADRGGIGAVWDPGVVHTSQTYERYLDAVERHDVPLYRTRDGDRIPFEAEGLAVTVLNPSIDSQRPDDLHYNSVSILIEYGDRTAILTGDAEADAEHRMVDDHGDDLDADLYHAGHHGSSTSSSDPFLDVVDPDAAIISAGYDSQYGHPHDEVLESFDERGIAAYWTAVHGTIVFTTDGEEWTVSPQADATTDPLALRNESAVDAEPSDSTDERSSISIRPMAPPAVGERLSVSA